ncbi:hypothetical protein NBRC10513v2_001930 [Rhodotorula toruloides]|uniref:BY PROTMAP: gi/472588004/gb/EMS25500.1/ Cystinosin/ERS1p repeat protein [Rhodosporidium toruloides NP11] gi/647401492/emb/CDR47774.1/ RHTO0S15e01728g1_1 [Rhodosporidium toruloides] n=1 Tax=Rhodotorula toruloides TaxID=5286 RepID=A0A0K3CLY7_RHOTO|nr:hypothetical protein AAT19DRAFT_15612 [Rhodotorula toruloides]
MLPLGGGVALALFHSRPTPSPSTCKAAFEHDTTGTVLSSLIIAGLLLSYAPQYIRIIRHKNSEGFSPLFLLLGATSSASSLGNIVTLQWGQVACCQYLTKGQCAESVLGIAQVFTQWFCFSLIFILYLVYYPLSSKYVRSVPIASSALPRRKPFLTSLVPDFMRTTTPSNLIRPSRSSASLTSDVSSADDETDDERAFNPSTFLLPGQLRRGEIILSSEYRQAVSLFLLTVLHFLLTFLTTFILLLTLPKAETPHQGTPSPWDPVPGNGGGREHPSERAVRVWATTLGLVSVALGCAQYAPQLVHTARRRLVGSLSIPMMMLQTPGSFVFVYTLAIRPGVNFTGWATYFVTGVLQGTLLVLCLVFRRRQKREGVDDWGEPLPGREGEQRDQGRGGERERLLR